jgi:Cytotoxic
MWNHRSLTSNGGSPCDLPGPIAVHRLLSRANYAALNGRRGWHMGKIMASISGGGDRPGYVAAPRAAVLAGFPGTFLVKPKTAFAGGKRRRWKDTDGMIYEWDYLHGQIEKYNSRGRHLGDFEWPSGRQLGGPNRGRSVEP